MNERTMLERAARAAGLDLRWHADRPHVGDWLSRKWWNPITDKGDAFRLAAKLHLIVDFYEGEVISANTAVKFDPNDIDAACLAIVRAAASLAEQDGQAQAGGV